MDKTIVHPVNILLVWSSDWK